MKLQITFIIFGFLSAFHEKLTNNLSALLSCTWHWGYVDYVCLLVWGLVICSFWYVFSRQHKCWFSEHFYSWCSDRWESYCIYDGCSILLLRTSLMKEKKTIAYNPIPANRRIQKPKPAEIKRASGVKGCIGRGASWAGWSHPTWTQPNGWTDLGKHFQYPGWA